jgi:hypothetical protein
MINRFVEPGIQFPRYPKLRRQRSRIIAHYVAPNLLCPLFVVQIVEDASASFVTERNETGG